MPARGEVQLFQPVRIRNDIVIRQHHELFRLEPVDDLVQHMVQAVVLATHRIVVSHHRQARLEFLEDRGRVVRASIVDDVNPRPRGEPHAGQRVQRFAQLHRIVERGKEDNHA